MFPTKLPFLPLLMYAKVMTVTAEQCFAWLARRKTCSSCVAYLCLHFVKQNTHTGLQVAIQKYVFFFRLA